MTDPQSSHALALSIQDFFTIVLVDPQDARNIGSVARAMGNLGFSRLSIVTDQEFDLKEARIMSCWGESILQSATVFNDLAAALADFEDVIGFSSVYGKNRISHITLPELAGQYINRALPKTALLFGSEVNGLQNVHVPSCRTLVRIPSVGDNPSFNLAQAVLTVLYELLRNSSAEIETPARELATWREYEELDKMCLNIMELTSYTSTGNPEAVLRAAFKRLALDRREMAMLLGLFSKIRKTLSLGKNDTGTLAK